MKKIDIIFIMALICIMLCGCSFNKQNEDATTKEPVYEAMDEDVYISTDVIVNEGGNYSMGYSANFIPEGENIVISEGLNEVTVTIGIDVDESLGWDVIPVRIYLIDNGQPIRFSTSADEEGAVFNDVTLDTSAGEADIILYFEEEELYGCEENLSLLVSFNPAVTQAAGELIFLSAAMGDSVPYINNYYEERNDVSLPLMKQELSIGKNDTVYLYYNSGGLESVSEKLQIGIIVDGELQKINGKDYFIYFNTEEGKSTLAYPLEICHYLDEGVHYIQSVLVSEDNGFVETGSRYTITITE